MFKLEEDYLPSLSLLSRISFVLLLLSLPFFAFHGGLGEYIREYLGLIWHFSMFFLIQKLPTPSWGRQAGTLWVVLDALSGLLYLLGFGAITSAAGMSLTLAIRLTANLFEGLWLISSSLTTKHKMIRLTGICGGLLLAGYSWVSPFAPAFLLSLNAPFVLVWLFLIAKGKYQE